MSKSLKSLLKNVYENNIDLRTTCEGCGKCCSVAMPQMYYCEFTNIIDKVWKKYSKEEKSQLICTSLEYFFRYEYKKWGMDSLIKPCMFLKDNKCDIYKERPLNCRLYGLWPEKEYNCRVDKFEELYKKYDLKREDLPLNTQCNLVKRKDNTVELTSEIIENLNKSLENIDKSINNYSAVQLNSKENYRTFHDWLLLKVFGDDFLSKLTSFVLAADREKMEEQIAYLKDEVKKNIINF